MTVQFTFDEGPVKELLRGLVGKSEKTVNTENFGMKWDRWDDECEDTDGDSDTGPCQILCETYSSILTAMRLLDKGDKKCVAQARKVLAAAVEFIDTTTKEG